MQNNQLLMMREAREHEYESLMLENLTLISKLDNLETVFIGQSSRDKQLPREYAESTI